MTTTQILAVARKHIGTGAFMDSSARLCLADADALVARGDDHYARRAALRSLSYSVGLFHPDYQAVAKAVAS